MHSIEECRQRFTAFKKVYPVYELKSNREWDIVAVFTTQKGAEAEVRERMKKLGHLPTIVGTPIKFHYY